MNPITSRTATGSFKPASPSSVRASLRRSVDPRRTAKIAAPSVAASAAPSSMPSSVVRSNSHAAAKPADQRGERCVPTVARLIAVPSTGRISWKPGAQPALEQDQRQADDPDRARDLVVVRLRRSRSSPSLRSRSASRAPRNSRRPGTRSRPAEQRGQQRAGEQRACGEDQLAVSHAQPWSSRDRMSFDARRRVPNLR